MISCDAQRHYYSLALDTFVQVVKASCTYFTLNDPMGTLTHGCLKVHGEVPIVYAFLLILYSHGSIAWSLNNV